MITIKPHHFLDIIKLHGAGYDKFIPDLKMGHNFYKTGNIILENPNILLNLCVNGDDICKPCHYFKDGKCDDGKEEYNRNLDLLMLERFDLTLNKTYTALELCEKLYLRKEEIKTCWKNEQQEKLEKRMIYFEEGAKKYILKYGYLPRHQVDFRAGMISAFTEIVGAGVKKIAFSAATNDVSELFEDMPSALFYAKKYQIHVYTEKNLLQTILFKDAPQMLYIFYKNPDDIQAYLQLKAMPQNTQEEKIEVARALGHLLSYEDNYIDELIQKSLS